MGITVEEVQDMQLAPVMTPMLAVMVWQNTNKLAGLAEGGGVGRLRFWACMHILMREGLIGGSVGRHHRDKSWDGMADEVRRQQALTRHAPQGPTVEDLQDSPEVSEEEAEDGGREIAAAPGTGAEAEADQLMILGGLEEEVAGGDAAEQGGAEGVRGDSTEDEAPEGRMEQWQEEESEAEVERNFEGEEMTQDYDPPVSLNWELAAQYEAAQRLKRQEVAMEVAAAARGRRRSSRQRGVDSKEGLEEQTEQATREWQEWKDQLLLEEQTETAVQGQRRISWQGEEDTGEMDCRGGVSVECQA